MCRWRLLIIAVIARRRANHRAFRWDNKRLREIENVWNLIDKFNDVIIPSWWCVDWELTFCAALCTWMLRLFVTERNLIRLLWYVNCYGSRQPLKLNLCENTQGMLGSNKTREGMENLHNKSFLNLLRKFPTFWDRDDSRSWIFSWQRKATSKALWIFSGNWKVSRKS